MTQYESGEKFIRVIQLYQRLCDTEVGLTTQQLADELEVTPRTVQRYVAVLRDSVGVDIDETDGRWTIGTYSKLPAMQLDRYQAMAVFTALRLLHRMQVDHDPALVGALAQLSRALRVDTVSQYLAETVADAEERPVNVQRRQVERTIVDGFIQRRSVDIEYRDGAGARSTRRIDPYFLEPRPEGKAIYLFAYDHKSSSVRSFKLARIHRAELTGASYEVDPTFDIAAITSNAWGIWIPDGDPEEVELVFTPAVADKVRETPLHRNARFSVGEDGRMTMTIDVTSSVEMQPWILGWGGDVEVVKPQSLREYVSTAHRKAAALYS